MKDGSVLFLNEREIKGLITAEEVLALTEESLRTYARGEAVNPIKLSLQLAPYHEGHINEMPSYQKPGELCGVKVVSVYGDNVKKYGIPTTMGTIVLYRPDSGLPYAILGGTYITEMRTGAASALFAKYLSCADTEIAAVVGAGAQGFACMEMSLLAMPQIREVRIFDLSKERCVSFAERLRAQYPGVRIVVADNQAEAVAKAKLVFYCTSANVKVMQEELLEPGVTVVVVAEKLTPGTIRWFDGGWFVDFAACTIERYNSDGAHAAEMAGRAYEPLTEDLVTGELGDVMIGKVPGRVSQDQRILAASVGMSIEDVSVAAAAYRNAAAKNVGLELEFQDVAPTAPVQ